MGEFSSQEEANSSASVNYDVELLHERLALSQLARQGVLTRNEKVTLNTIFLSRISFLKRLAFGENLV